MFEKHLCRTRRVGSSVVQSERRCCFKVLAVTVIKTSTLRQRHPKNTLSSFVLGGDKWAQGDRLTHSLSERVKKHKPAKRIIRKEAVSVCPLLPSLPFLLPLTGKEPPLQHSVTGIIKSVMFEKRKSLLKIHGAV